MELGIKMTERLKENKTNKKTGSVFLDCSSGKGKETLNAIKFSDPISGFIKTRTSVELRWSKI